MYIADWCEAGCSSSAFATFTPFAIIAALLAPVSSGRLRLIGKGLRSGTVSQVFALGAGGLRMPS